MECGGAKWSRIQSYQLGPYHSGFMSGLPNSQILPPKVTPACE